jgi:hypothetical protein
MPNKVLTIFEADASQYFQVADKVKANAQSFANQPIVPPQAASPAAAAQAASPAIAAEKAVTQAVADESTKRDQIEQTASKRSEDLVKQELATHVDFFKTREAILDRHAKSEVEMEAKVAAAAEKRALIEKVATQKQFDYNVAVALELDKLRLQSVRKAIAAEETQTAVVVREAEKQAVARRSAFTGRDSLSLPIGGGLSSRLGIVGPAALGIGAAFAITAGEIASIRAYSQEVTEASQRTARLSAASSDLGFAQKDLSKAVDETASSLRITKAEATDLVTSVADLASKTREPLTDLKDAVIDVASARGIDKASLPHLLDDIAKGTADTALLGQNAAAVFDIYAAKLGKTADQLSEAEKRQALVNRLLSEGALNAGANANALDKDAVSVDALDKSWNKFLATLAGAGAAKAGIDALTKALGGEPEFGRFDPSRAFNTPGFGDAARADAIGIGRFTISSALRGRLTPEKIFADDIAAADAESAKRNAEYVRLFNENRQAILDAAQSPTANVVNAALSKLNFDQLKAAFPNPADLRKFLDKQITDFKGVQESKSQAIETALTQGAGNLTELRRLRQVIPTEIIDPAETRRLSQVASKAISDTFKDAIESSKDSVPKLRELYRQIATAPDIAPLEKNGLVRSINDQIKQVIDNQTAKVKELANSARSAFDSVFAREGARNPYLAFLDSVAKRTEDVRRQTQGLGADITNALLARNNLQNALDLSQLHFNTATSAFNLRSDAGAFQRFRDTGSTDSREVQSIKNFVSAQGQMSPFWTNYWNDQLKRAQDDDFQNNVDAQINIARQSFLNGPAGKTPDARSLFDQAVIKATPLDQIDRLSRDQINQGIFSRQEEAQHQIEQEQEALKQREEQIALQTRLANSIDALLKRIEQGKGIPVDLGNQAITVVEVTSPKLGVSKRSSTSSTKKSTADAMEPN